MWIGRKIVSSMQIQVSWERCKILNNMKKDPRSLKKKNQSFDSWALSYKQIKLNRNASTTENNEIHSIIYLLKDVWTNELQAMLVQIKSHMHFICTCSSSRHVNLKWGHISNLKTIMHMFTPTLVNLGWSTQNNFSIKGSCF